MKAGSAKQGWLLLALVAVVAQEALTIYPGGQGAQHAFWGGMSLLLLYRVHRGGELARRIFLVIALFGVVVFLATPILSAAAVDLARVGPLFLAYVVQAGVMLLPSIRNWTRQHRQAEPVPVAVG